VARMLVGKATEALSQEEIVAETTGQIIAGTDTTSTTLSFLLFELSKRPDVSAKLQAEIDSVIVDPASIPDNRTLRDLPYLNSVISEDLRIYSAQPSPLDRIVPPAHGPLRILGYDIPAGTLWPGRRGQFIEKTVSSANLNTSIQNVGLKVRFQRLPNLIPLAHKAILMMKRRNGVLRHQQHRAWKHICSLSPTALGCA